MKQHKLRATLFWYGIPALAVFLLIVMIINMFLLPKRIEHTPYHSPARTEYGPRIAGLGIIESKSENLFLGTEIGGIVSSIKVVTNQKVKKGEVLFTISDLDTKAQLELALAKKDSAEINVKNAKKQLGFYKGIENSGAISQEDLSNRQFALKTALAALQEAKASVDLLRTTLKRLKVKAPIDGEILRVNIHPGEFAPTGVVQTPLVVMGDTSLWHVRVQMDEIDIQRLKPYMKATGALRSDGKKTVPLTFVRIEPLVGPKNIIQGNGNELIDTRIMEVIYSFPNETLGAYIGQQMDVFVDASQQEPSKAEANGKEANVAKDKVAKTEKLK